jgi:hypothetical protein
MIRYRYNDQVQPPAPFVNVGVRCPGTGAQVVNQAALLDYAADRSVLPERMIAALGLVEDGHLLFQGFAGQVVELPIFLVEIRIHDLPAVLIRAVLGRGEPFILLGRDVLNSQRVLLDGPQLALEIDSP